MIVIAIQVTKVISIFGENPVGEAKLHPRRVQAASSGPKGKKDRAKVAALVAPRGPIGGHLCWMKLYRPCPPVTSRHKRVASLASGGTTQKSVC